MNDLGFVADAPDVGFVPDSTESNDLGFVPDQQPPLEIDESGLPSNVSPRQRKRLGLMSELAAEQSAQDQRDKSNALIEPIQNLAEGALTGLSLSPSRIAQQFERGIPAVSAAIRGEQRFTPLPPVVSSSLNPGENRSIKIPEIPTTKETPVAGQIAAGLGNAVIDFANIFTTPEGIMSLGIGGLPKETQKAVIGTMAANMAANYPQEFGEAIDAAKQGDYATATKKIISTPVMSAVMGRGSIEPIKIPKAPEFPGLPDPDLVARNLAEPGTVRPQEQQRFGAPEIPEVPRFEAGDVPFNRMQRFGGQQIPPVEILPQMGRIENVPILEEPRPIEQRETRGKVSFGAEAPVLLRNATEQARQVGLTESAKAAEQVAETTTPKGENKMPPYRAPKPAPTAEQTARVAARESVEKGLTMEMPPMEEAPPEVGQFPEEGGPTGTLSKLQRSRIQAGKQNVRTNVENNPPVKRRTLAQLRDELGRGGERGAIDPTILDDIVEHGRNLLAKGMDFAQWSAEMIKQFGDKIIDHLAPVWRRISETTKEGGINARSITSPAEVHGDLRPQPTAREGQVPVAEGGEGVQPREVQEPAPLREAQEVAPKEAPVVYRGHQPGYGKVPAMELYNLTETISPTLVKGSTVTEATLAKEGYSIPESAKPPKRKTLSELGRDLPDAGESGAVHIPFDDIINKVVERMRKVRDYVTIDPIPRLTRAMGGDIGTGNNSAIQHASARVAVPRMIDDLLAKVFQDQYKNPDEMRKTVEVINKDNILGGYDSFIQQAAAAQTAGHGSAAAHYRQMARDVANVHDLVGYERDVRAAQADPAITENIKRWNDVVNPQLDQLYNEMKGMDANTPRPGRGRIFGARVNLLPKSEEGRWIDALNDEEKPIPSPSSSNYRNPNAKKDKFDRRAKFTGEYSDNPAAVLANVLSHRWNEVTKIRFLNDLIRSGAGSWEKPADGLIHGKEAKPLPVKLPETKTEMVNGAAVDSSTKQVEKTIWVPEDVVSDVRGIIDTDLRLKQNPIARGLTTLQLAQLADAFTHTKNLHSVIANAQGTKAMWSDVVRKMPGLSSLDTAGRITKVLYDITQDTPEIRAEMADMAKNGMLRQHFPATGLQKITKMQDMIHHVDTAARVVMNRFYDNLVERGMAVDTLPARRKFVQQVGEYNKRLMGPMMQSMSRAGFSPFIVAGRNFNRFGRRMLTGHPGFEATSNSAALKARLVNFTTLGTIFVLPMILNQVLTGNIYGRKGTPIGAVDMNTAVDEKGAHKVLDLASLYGVRRGMRAIGVDSIVEGLRAGETPDNIVGKAIHDVISTAAHPWAGPALGAAWQTLTGTRLDLRGGPTPVEARKVGDRFSGSQFAENARVAFKNQNPMLYSPFRPLFNDTEESAGKDFVKDWFLKTPATTVGIRDVKSPALSKAAELMGSYQKTPEQEEKSKLKRQLVKSLHEGDKAPLQQARKDKALENRDVEEVKERAKSPLIYMVKKLGAVDAVKVWELADENERKLITPIVNQHILNSTVLDTKEKRKYREQIGTLKPIDK